VQPPAERELRAGPFERHRTTVAPGEGVFERRVVVVAQHPDLARVHRTGDAICSAVHRRALSI
jgi:uracil-DNA glycosylase